MERLSIAVLLLVPAVLVLGQGYGRGGGGGSARDGVVAAALPRTYNLETEEDRYGRYERVLLGLKSSEGLHVDDNVLEQVRAVIFEEEEASLGSSGHGERLIAVHLGRPKQSREVAQLQYKNRVRF